jgi:MFS family permease
MAITARGTGATTDGHGRTEPGVLAVVRIPGARRIHLADLISGTGDTLYWVALVVVLIEADGGGTLVAAAVIARLAPRLLFGALAGVVVDRTDGRRLMMILDAGRAVLMVVLAVVVSLDGPPSAVLVIVFLVGMLGTPYRPSVSVLLATTVGERLLAPANALASSTGQVVALTGPLVAAAVLAIAAPSWAFVANALTFAASVILVAGIPPSLHVRLDRARRPGLLAELRAGLSTVGRQDGIAIVLGLAVLLTLVRGAEMVLYVRVAGDSLDLGAGGYGLLTGAVGGGALLAVPFVGHVAATRAESRVLIIAAAASIVPLLVLATVTSLPIVLLALAVQGAATVVFEVLGLTMVQRLCTLTSLGRVLGVQSTAAGGSKLVGSVLAPVTITALGVSGGLVTVAAVALGGTAALTLPALGLGRRLSRRRAEIEPRVDVLGTLAIFDGASRPTIERLAMHSTVERVPARTVLIREGEPADDFYVIASGELTVHAGGQTINHLVAPDWCGELGLLQRAARTATVVTTTDTVVWRIPGAELIAALTAGASLPQALVDDMAWRIARSDAAVAASEHP